MIAGLVMAGGQGRRLGGADKALVSLAGRPLLDHVLERLRPQVDRIALSANGDPARFAAWGLTVLPDPVDEGPLAGLLAGLGWAAGQGADTLLSMPVDTPFIPPDLAWRLAPPPSCASSAGRVHHLAALWPVAAAREALGGLLATSGSRAVVRLAERLGTRPVEFPASPDPFLNLNTRADLEEAERRIASN
jgi:molybdopterin-guanine dinucleotide biosynthesis protein A